MNLRTLLKSYNLKWNPFSKDIPDDALVVSKAIEHFLWRIERLVDEGGFALITGEPGTGKSAAMRILRHKLQAEPRRNRRPPRPPPKQRGGFLPRARRRLLVSRSAPGTAGVDSRP